MDVSGAVSDARWNGPTLARVSARRILFDEPESLFQREGGLGCQVHNRVRIESEEHHPGNGAGQDNGEGRGRDESGRQRADRFRFRMYITITSRR